MRVQVCRHACLSDQDAPVRRENLQLVTIQVHLQRVKVRETESKKGGTDAISI